MSYDIEVFSTEKSIAPASEEGRGWQIAVDGPLNVEAEDIPAQIRTSSSRAFDHRSPKETLTSSAQKKLLTMARGVARIARGIVVDTIQGTVETPHAGCTVNWRSNRSGRAMAFFSCHGLSRMSLLWAEPFQQKCWTSFSERFLRSCPGAMAFGSPRSSSSRRMESIICANSSIEEPRDNYRLVLSQAMSLHLQVHPGSRRRPPLKVSVVAVSRWMLMVRLPVTARGVRS